MKPLHELFDGSNHELISDFRAWLESQEDDVAACDHITFGEKVWRAARQARVPEGCVVLRLDDLKAIVGPVMEMHARPPRLAAYKALLIAEIGESK